MRCDDVRSRLADRLDDLLDAAETAEIDRHLEECEVCAEGSRDLRGRLALLYRADADLHPPPELRERILVAAMPRPRIGLGVLLRYAAVFLAGVGVAFAVRPEPRVIEVPVERVVLVNAAPEESPVVKHDAPRVPRRIR
jgi:anti-sigma factor RsiW